MFFILLVFILVMAIAFFQVIQGIFSALIMTLLTILSAMLAFNFYEPLAMQLVQSMPDSNPMYIYAASLMTIFFVSLLLLRTAFDMVITSDAGFGIWTNRIGGGVLGIISGMIIVGVFAVAVQMLPWSGRVMGYRPFDNDLKRDSSLAPFYPDRFVLGMVKGLSNGSLSSEAGTKGEWTRNHEDLLLELYAERNRGVVNQVELPSRNDAPAGSLTVVGTYQPPENTSWLNSLPQYLPDVSASDKYIIRVVVSEKAREAGSTNANWMILPATQFRLVATNGKSYYPLGFLTFTTAPASRETNWKVITGSGGSTNTIAETVVERNTDKPLTVDWVYRLPPGVKPFCVAFRRVSIRPTGPLLVDQLPPAAGALNRNEVH